MRKPPEVLSVSALCNGKIRSFLQWEYKNSRFTAEIVIIIVKLYSDNKKASSKMSVLLLLNAR